MDWNDMVYGSWWIMDKSTGNMKTALIGTVCLIIGLVFGAIIGGLGVGFAVYYDQQEQRRWDSGLHYFEQKNLFYYAPKPEKPFDPDAYLAEP